MEYFLSYQYTTDQNSVINSTAVAHIAHMRPRCNIHNNEITDIFPKDDKD